MNSAGAGPNKGPGPEVDPELDLAQVNGPLPILKTKAEFAEMVSGEPLCMTDLVSALVRALRRGTPLP